MADEENQGNEPGEEIPGGEAAEEPVDKPTEETPGFETIPEVPESETTTADKTEDEGEPPGEQEEREEIAEPEAEVEVEQIPQSEASKEIFVQNDESTSLGVAESLPAMVETGEVKSSSGLVSKSSPIRTSESAEDQRGFIETKRTKSEKYNLRAKLALGSQIDIRKSMGSELADRRAVRYANSYKMESDNPFNPEKVDKILEAVMTEALENLTYDKDKCLKQAKWASLSIRSKVKELEFDRYKLISNVTIGEKNSQDVFVACRFLWDAEKDRYSFFSMENTYVYGIAMCFGIYYE